MKKIINYIAVVLISFSAIACDEDAESNESIAGFLNFSANFIYPAGETLYPAKDSHYTLFFDGDTIKHGRGYVDRKNPKGILRVFDNTGNSTTLETVTVISKANDVIQLLSIGDEVYVYSSDKFVQFTSNVIYLAGQAELCKAFLGEQTLLNGVNYTPSGADKNKAISIKRNGVTLYNESVTLTEGKRFDFFQVTENEFVNVTVAVDEANPQDKKHSKVRFFIDPATVSAQNVRLVIYEGTDIINTYDFNSKSLSPFVELNNDGNYKYDIYDIADIGNPLIVASKRTVSLKKDGVYKFQTLKTGKYSSSFLLGTEW